ncbi:galactokinase [Corynebacterium aquatimens]|uniref:Galactokinase n=1 Tax=Corynebacterium aquatimens TaxID=1190508 RepID=A0A931DY20_9CORY|nr:galactokinase [Corynebacterium aquatimens]MBG6122447.1 galactokinase [Corynebacterium aquatimens]
MIVSETRSPERLAADAREFFAAHIDHALDSDGPANIGVWVAPGRINLIGDHVDYASGVCLPFATTMATAVAARKRDDGAVRMISQSPTGEILDASVALADLDSANADAPPLPDWRGYIAGTVHALGAGGMDIAVVSDVPLGSGLSSSAALECAVGVAARDLYDLSTSDDDLIAATMRAENHYVGANTGGLDQNAVVRGKEGYALALDFLEGTHEQVPCALEGYTLLVSDSHVEHSHATGGYGSRRGLIDRIAAELDCTFREDDIVERAVNAFTGNDTEADTDFAPDVIRRRVRHVHSETTRTIEAIEALKAGDIPRFGELMNESHASLRDDYEIVPMELETAVQAALSAGAIGARITGGGFGGSIIALCSDPEAVATAIEDATAERGYPTPTIYATHAVDGARKV